MKCQNCNKTIWKYAGSCRLCGYCFSIDSICPIFKKDRINFKLKLPDNSTFEMPSNWKDAFELKLKKEKLSLEEFKKLFLKEVEKHWRARTLPTKCGEISWSYIAEIKKMLGKEFSLKNMAEVGERVMHFLLIPYFIT